MKYNAILLFLNVIIICLLHHAHGRTAKVIGGSDPQPEETKFLVSMQILGWHVCGGGIIDDKFILTAAHCVINIATNRFKKGPWKIAAGTNFVNDTNAIIVDVEKIFVPKYFHISKNPYDAWDSDIAVLRLNQSLNLMSNPRLQKLNLATKPISFPNDANVKAKVAGFGTDRFERHESWGGYYDVLSVSGQAHQINVIILEPDECRKFSKIDLPKSEFCARISEPRTKLHIMKRPAGTCSGDSGSPVVYENDTVIGIVARSEKPCNQNVIPGHYTRVSSHINFIQNAMNDVTNDMRIVDYSTIL